MSTLIDSHLVGQSIKHLRLSRNWTQDRLATTAGYSVRNLRRIENDGTTSIDIVNTFADIFDVSALDILSGDVFYFQTKMGLAHLCAFWALPINPITNKNSRTWLINYYSPSAASRFKAVLLISAKPFSGVCCFWFSKFHYTGRLFCKKSIGSLRHTILTLIYYSHTSTPGWVRGSDPNTSNMGYC